MNFAAKIAALVDGAQSIRATADAEGRELTDEELSKIEANMAQVDELKEKQARHDAAMARLNAENSSLDKPQPRKTAVQPSASIEVKEPEWTKDPKRDSRLTRNF